MASTTEIVVSIDGKVLSVPMALEIHFHAAPLSLRLSVQQPISIAKIWDTISDALYQVSGLHLPNLSDGPWSKFLDISESLTIQPSLWITPTGPQGDYSAYLELEFSKPIHIGGEWSKGPITITFNPNIAIEGLYISYDKGAGGFDFKAKISTPTEPGSKQLALGDGSPNRAKTQIVSYPFPIPSQGSVPTFKLNYLGLGQRVGPTVVVTGDDPMVTIFHQLETQLIGSDPKEILTNLAKNFYRPDRDWFIAADVSFGGFNLKVLFNDPAMYGLRLTAGDDTPLKGLLFEILYQKLGPNLGVYYGALTLPDALRRIVLDGVILILPGFSIWIYTNGDFKVNVGWPLGGISIGIQVGILVGIAGFYFARLRSGDNPGAQPSVNYNPILEFGIGISVYVQQSFNASIFSATLSVTLTATFQGLLAWLAGDSPNGSSLAQKPDHYWFAGTASLAVLIQGSVDFAILKASVTISLNANVGVAFETTYLTVVAVSASVSVEVSVKVLFITIHLSFSTSISHNFYIGSGSTPASIDHPLAPGLEIAGAPKTEMLRAFGGVQVSRESMRAEALAAAQRLMAGAASPSAAPGFRAAWKMTPTVAPITLPVHFVLQPTAVYEGSPSGVNLIASLFMQSPAPGAGPSQPETPFEQLIRGIVTWLLSLRNTTEALSARFQYLVDELGSGTTLGSVFGGSWEGFAIAFRNFIQSAFNFQVQGTSSDSNQPEIAGAMLPMIDALLLTYTGPDGKQYEIPFDTHNPTPSNYPAAVNAYYEELSWSGSGQQAGMISEVWRATGSPLETPSMAAYLFYDYFLMQSRNAARQLLQAAESYEGVATEEFLAEVEEAHARGVSDPWHFSDLALGYRNRVVEDELAYLLSHFDYVSAAGMGSRTMLQGLQLPDPGATPDNPTPQNMADVSTYSLYVLTGQQFPVASTLTTGTAALSLSPTAQVPPGWIAFDTASPPHSSAATPLPGEVPPAPSPTWSGTSLLRSGSTNGEIDLNAILPLTPHPLYFSLKNQVSWKGPEGTQTILPLPQPVSAMLASRSDGLQLSISTEPPNTHSAASPASQIPATGGLLIRLSLSQVPHVTNVNAGPTGSPSHGGSPGGSGPVQYLPFVYQLNGTDQATRDLIELALNEDLSNATISLLYTPPKSGTMVSQELDPEALLAKVNLSTLNQAPKVSLMLAAKLMAPPSPPGDFATVRDAAGFLRLIWELSVVNATGFLLYYLTKNGQDLPAELFADAGVGGGQTAQFNILVQFGNSANPVSLQRCQNCVVIAESSPVTSNALYAAVLESTGSPVLEYSPSYLPGNVAFDVVWKQAEVSPEPLIPVDRLYQLIQFQIAPLGDYRSSVWSLPAGPTRNNSAGAPELLSAANIWNYQQSVPAYRFSTASPATASPYGNVGQTVSLGFRLIDIYGNPLPGNHQSPFTPLYNDPLAALTEWPGVATSFYVVPGTSTSATLLISSLFDPETLVMRGAQSPPLSSKQPSARQQWQKIQARYQLLLFQLEDPNLSVSITSSLTGGSLSNCETLRAQFIDFVTRILAQIEHAIETSSPAEEWSAQPVPLSIELALPFAAVIALPSDIFPVGVTIAFSRKPEFVYPDAATQLPSVLSVSSSIAPNLHLSSGSPVASPSGGTGVRNFSMLFEAAFANFDRAGGQLKLAQRAGISTGEGSGQVESFWAVRWGATSGISIEMQAAAGSPSESLVYFAVRPLSTKLMSGPVQVGGSPADTRTFSNIDIDQWAYQFLRAFDTLLTPAFAVAIAILDRRNGTGYYQELMTTKQNLASVVPLGLLPVFADQAEMGDAYAAQQRLQEAMLVTLSSAFSISTVMQTQASVNVVGRADFASPILRAPQLYGTVGPVPSGSPSTPSPNGLQQYSISPGELSLSSGEQWITTLVSVAQPKDQAELVLPLTYQVSYLQHDFGTPEMGYTPSSWLKFVLPGDAALDMPISANAQIPIPLMFYPDPPALISQAGVAAGVSSPPLGSPNIENEIAAALGWNYVVQLGHNWAMQDQLFFEVTFNETFEEHAYLRAFAGSRRTVENLFAALARFQLAYPGLEAQMNSILIEAYPTHGKESASPGTAQAVISQFAALAAEVESVWPDYKPGFGALMAGAPLPRIIEDYYIQLDRVPGRLHLFGHGQTGAAPLQWPVVTVNGQAWDPQAGSPLHPVEVTEGNVTWWEITHDFKGVTNPENFFRHIELSWTRLDIRKLQTATLSGWVTRNASLVEGRQTAKPFIYDTEPAAFRDPVIPLLQVAELKPLLPTATLANTLDQILSPISLVGQDLDCYMRLSLDYSYDVSVSPLGVPVMASMPILLADDIPMGSSWPVSDIATKLATQTAAWYSAIAPSTAGAVLSLRLTLFGTVRGQQLPLVDIGKIPILVGDRGPDWWNGPV